MSISVLGSPVESVRTATTDPYTFTFDAGTNPRGLLILCTQTGSSTDNITTIDFNGVSLTRVLSAADTVGESGRSYIYLLKSGVPTGSNTVTVDLASATTDDMQFVAVALSAIGDVMVINTQNIATDTLNPSVTMAVKGHESMAFGAFYSGLNDITNATPNANMTAIFTEDFGTQGGRVDRQTSVSTSDFVFSYTASSDDVALAVASIAQTPQGYGQAQAQIRAFGYPRYGQAQADVLATNRAYGQSQADILVTFRGFAQSQAAIEVTVNVFAQSNADIKAISSAFAQSNTDIKATSIAVAQSQADILQILQGYAQAQADILVTNTVFSQAQAFIEAPANLGFAQANTVPGFINNLYSYIDEISFNDGDYIVSGLGANNYYETLLSPTDPPDYVQEHIIHFRAQSNESVDLLVELRQGATVRASSQVTLTTAPFTYRYALSPSEIANITAYTDLRLRFTPVGPGVNTRVIVTWATLQLPSSLTRNQYAQAQARILATSNAFAQAQADILSTSRGYGQAQTDILFTTDSFGQANALIVVQVTAYAQAQADVDAVSNAYGQAQADILATSDSFAQAQATIGQFTNVFAQVQAQINAFGVNLFAQAQTKISTLAVYAEAQAQTSMVKFAKQNVRGQAKAQILAFGVNKFAQARPRIKKVGNQSYGQAMVSIQGRVFAQAQAQIIGFDIGRFAQAQTKIYGIFGYQSAWVQANIRSFDYPRIAHVQASIYNGIFTQSAQTQAQIKKVENNKSAQVRTYIVNYLIRDTFATIQTITDPAVFPIVAYGDFPNFTGDATDPDEIRNDWQGDPTFYTGWIKLVLTAPQTLKFNLYGSGMIDTVMLIYNSVGQPAVSDLSLYQNDDNAENPYNQTSPTDTQSSIPSNGVPISFATGTYWIGVFPLSGGNWDIAEGGVILTIANAKSNFGFAQAGTYIRKITTRIAQAQALLNTGLQTAQAAGQITSNRETMSHGYSQTRIKHVGRGYANTSVYVRPHMGIAQANAQIIKNPNKSAQAQAYIGHFKTGMAQAFIDTARYLVKFNEYVLPGYLQEQDLKSLMDLYNYSVNSFLWEEAQGLTNKQISVRLKLIEDSYTIGKTKIELAGTYLRSKRNGYSKLLLGDSQKYYLAQPETVILEQSAGGIERTPEYSVDFDVKPWLYSQAEYTISGTTLVDTDQVSRDLSDGTWTYPVIILTGTDITISGYTANEFTGFASISGYVNNLIIDTENYTATINGENQNELMSNKDYQILVGPGKTSFTISGATECQITYRNRWSL